MKSIGRPGMPGRLFHYFFQRIGKYILSCRLRKCERSEHFFDNILERPWDIIILGFNMLWFFLRFITKTYRYAAAFLPKAFSNKNTI